MMDVCVCVLLFLVAVFHLVIIAVAVAVVTITIAIAIAVAIAVDSTIGIAFAGNAAIVIVIVFDHVFVFGGNTLGTKHYSASDVASNSASSGSKESRPLRLSLLFVPALFLDPCRQFGPPLLGQNLLGGFLVLKNGSDRLGSGG